MFIVMELVDGQTLADVIAKQGPLAPRRVLALTRQICQGLAHAHERGLIHRDLKPDNIVLAGRDHVRLVDFGLAVPLDDERSTRLTGVGLAMGTPIYAAPEQTHAQPVDHRADLFALGVTMFEMLAGKPPFEGGLVDIIRQNASDEMPAIMGKSGKRIPSLIEDVVRTLMRRDPAARYADANAVLAALDAAQIAPSRMVSLPDLPPPPSPRKGGIASALVGVAMFAGLAIGGQYVEPLDDPSLVTSSMDEPSLVAGMPTATTPTVTTTTPSAGIVPIVTPLDVAAAPVEAVAAIAAPVTSKPAVTKPAVTKPAAVRTVKPARESHPTIASIPEPAATTGRANGEAATHAPAKGEPTNVDPSRIDPSKVGVATEPAKDELTKAELAKVDPANVESAKAEAANQPTTDPSKTESPKTELTRAQSTTPEPAKVAKIDPPKVEPTAAAIAKPAPPPLWTTAQVRVVSLRVRGALPNAEVRRAVERVLPATKTCYARAAKSAAKSPVTTASITLAIDESRRASDVNARTPVLPSLGVCIASALDAMRVQTVPDTGDVAVSLELSFQPVGP